MPAVPSEFTPDLIDRPSGPRPPLQGAPERPAGPYRPIAGDTETVCHQHVPRKKRNRPAGRRHPGSISDLRLESGLTAGRRAPGQVWDRAASPRRHRTDDRRTDAGTRPKFDGAARKLCRSGRPSPGTAAMRPSLQLIPAIKSKAARRTAVPVAAEKVKRSPGRAEYVSGSRGRSRWRPVVYRPHQSISRAGRTDEPESAPRPNWPRGRRRPPVIQPPRLGVPRARRAIGRTSDAEHVKDSIDTAETAGV